MNQPISTGRLVWLFTVCAVLSATAAGAAGYTVGAGQHSLLRSQVTAIVTACAHLGQPHIKAQQQPALAPANATYASLSQEIDQ
ncbi:MAG TPA: hypothetical protein VFQ95_00255 [Rhodanobacteraceae bacterium]|nr:hypothetical protein [Rhodanobacteraceae bacterium]